MPSLSLHYSYIKSILLRGPLWPSLSYILYIFSITGYDATVPASPLPLQIARLFLSPVHWTCGSLCLQYLLLLYPAGFFCSRLCTNVSYQRSLPCPSCLMLPFHLNLTQYEYILYNYIFTCFSSYIKIKISRRKKPLLESLLTNLSQ